MKFDPIAAILQPLCGENLVIFLLLISGRKHSAAQVHEPALSSLGDRLCIQYILIGYGHVMVVQSAKFRLGQVWGFGKADRTHLYKNLH